jgi:hypothetical protein
VANLEGAVGPPATKNQDTNWYRDVDNEHSKVIHRKPFVMV